MDTSPPIKKYSDYSKKYSLSYFIFALTIFLAAGILSFIAGIIFLDATGSYNATADDLKPILYPLALALVLTPLLCVAVVLEGRKQKKQYLEWCETQNVDFLTRLTSSPEVDDEGKELIIEHLSIINPGWSLK